jgi:hypothetical protein
MSDEDGPLAIKALEHFDAYLKATRRENGEYAAGKPWDVARASRTRSRAQTTMTGAAA